MLTQQHITAIEEAAQTLESAAKFNSRLGRDNFAYIQANRAKRLREVLKIVKQEDMQNGGENGPSK